MSETSPSPHQGINLLLVDDREENLLALESLLASEPLVIHKARSGQEALELMLKNEYAAALLDVQMPKMDGFALAELMRGVERTKNIPIVFVTAADRNKQNVFKGYESGAVDFLYKPLDPLIVKSKVRIFMELEVQRRVLKNSLEELQAAFTTLKSTEAELKRAVNVRDDFLAIASHELRTPLTPMILHIQSLLRLAKKKENSETIPSEKVITTAEKMDNSAKRILALVESLLDVTRITSGQLTLDCAELNLSKLTSDVVERFMESLVENQCEVETTIEPGIQVWADKIRLDQVMSNLISNAVKYAAGHAVKVRLKVLAGNACLEVEDQGTGIPLEAQKRIFDRFERATDGRHISGLGLGLYIARQIVETHGGKISLESEPGRGSCFKVLIPLLASKNSN